jgi:glycosyltransferase involved in cell wall biosynthesis
MLSILIPTYNDDLHPLLESLYRSAELNTVACEVLIFNDNSVAPLTFTGDYKNLQIIDSTINVGRTMARYNLAKAANYDWLLFLDADVEIYNEDFISKYLEVIKRKDVNVCFGGYAYNPAVYNERVSLRYHYGVAKEQIPAKERNKNPYKVIISGNFIILKETFLSLPLHEQTLSYGLDNYFGSLLKGRHVPVIHIDNAVYHNGLDTNEIYLRKKERAAETLVKLYGSGKMKHHNNDLLATFEKIVNLHLITFFTFLNKVLGPSLKKNMLGPSPSIKQLQVYRLLYICSYYKKGQQANKTI